VHRIDWPESCLSLNFKAYGAPTEEVMNTLRTFTTENFRVVLSWEYETDFDHSWADDETLEKLESGEWTSFLFKVAVYDASGAEVGVDYLGDSIHADPCEFMDHRECGRYNRELAAKGAVGRCGSYFKDMVASAIAEARRSYQTPRTYLRAA
jgi:hypothetical protein